jgi:tetratricopeptide (TPR) repeat protein
MGWVARERGDAAAATAFLEESIALSHELGEQHQGAWSLLTLAGVAILCEDAANAESLITRGIALNPGGHDWLAWSFNHLGHAAQLRGDYEQAELLQQKALAVFVDQLGDRSAGLTWVYQSLGEIALAKGDAALAQHWLRTGLQLSHEINIRIATIWCLAGLGGAAALGGHPARAARLWGAAERLRAALGYRSAPAARATYERLVALARSQIGVDAFAAAFAAGESLSLDRAIAEGLGGEGYNTEQDV